MPPRTGPTCRCASSPRCAAASPPLPIGASTDSSPYLALALTGRRSGPDTVLIVDGTLIPTRDHAVAAPSKNSRYAATLQIMIQADTRLVTAIGQPQPGHRNDGTASTDSNIPRAAAGATGRADGGYPGTGLLIPHRRQVGQPGLPACKDRDHTGHRNVRTRIEHPFARRKTCKILRDCRRRGRGVYWATTGVAHPPTSPSPADHQRGQNHLTTGDLRDSL